MELTHQSEFRLFECIVDGFPVIAETTRNHTFSKETSQVMLAAMVLVPNCYCKNCQPVISAMTGNPSSDFPARLSKKCFQSKK